MAVVDLPRGIRPKPPLSCTWFDDIEPSLDSADFVQGLLIEQSAVVVYGESNSGKTFWTLDLALHVATGTRYCGRRVEFGGVIYCALEGSARFRNRVVAWRRENEVIGETPFGLVESDLNLLDPNADTERLIALIQSAAEHIAPPVKLIVIDTLSRALAGGNENAPDDMGALVINMDRIRRETNACVLFIHHAGKDTAKGARGHSLLRAAVDTEIEVDHKDGCHSATVVKQRELTKGECITFSLKATTLGENRYGEAVTTCVVGHDEVSDKPREQRAKLPKNSQIAADMLSHALVEVGGLLPLSPQYPDHTRAVSERQWRDAFYRGYPGETQDTKRRVFTRAKEDLISKRIVASINDYVWFVRKGDE